MERDYKDTNIIITYLSQNNPLATDNSALRNIATGLVAEKNVNCDKAKEVGEKVIKLLKGKKVVDYSFRRKDQAVTFASKISVKVKDGEVHINPQLLFQRLCLVITAGRYDNPAQFFEYEMCSYPAAIFDESLLPRKANKPVLSEAIRSLTKDDQVDVSIKNNAHYVLDGGALLHRVIWPSGMTYNAICSLCIQYIKRRYPSATIVFDGYDSGPTTKDCTHKRRNECGPEVIFQAGMSMTLKKDNFLSNHENKQRFLNLLSDALEGSGYRTIHATNDADLLIVQTAVAQARNGPTVLVGDDTDLLVLLLYHAKVDSNELYFHSEPRAREKIKKMWDIKKTKEILGADICNNILFVHAILGCDTTSRVHGLGKGVALKKLTSSASFLELANVFTRDDVCKDEVIAAGEKALLHLYNSESSSNLNALRYSRFCQKVASGKVTLQPENLPPTSSSASFHSLRVYWQVQAWMGKSLEPENWGWKLINGAFIPILTDRPPAHQLLLEIIRCNCKSDCSTNRCSCKRNGLECTAACGICKGESCLNSLDPDFDTGLDDLNGPE